MTFVVRYAIFCSRLAQEAIQSWKAEEWGNAYHE